MFNTVAPVDDRFESEAISMESPLRLLSAFHMAVSCPARVDVAGRLL